MLKCLSFSLRRRNLLPSNSSDLSVTVQEKRLGN